MNIHFHVTYSLDKKLAPYYNGVMAMYPDEDFVVLCDGDSMFTLNDFGHKIKEVIDANPEYGLFTCLTNRVACPYQVVRGMEQEERMNEHWRLGKELWEKNGTKVIDITNEQLLSGVLMCISVKEFNETGGFSGGAMLGVDNSIHAAFAASGKKVGLMLGIYVMHYYRNNKPKNIEHLS